MKIVVCAKQVASRDTPVRVNAAGTWIRDEDASWTMNEPDTFALETALRQKDAGAEVVVISAGPARVGQLLRECLNRGADRAIHVMGDHLSSAGPMTTARALLGAVADEAPDLVLTGLQSEDQGSGQVGVILAELLGVAHSTLVLSLDLADGRVRVKRELETGWSQWVTLPMPAVLAIQSGANQLRYATLKGTMAAKKREIRVVPAPEAGAPEERLIALYPPRKTAETRFIPGTPAEAARELVRILRDELPPI